MPNTLTNIQVQVDGDAVFQTIDGFGVNINSKHWKHGALIPTLDLLLNDLGACLYRVDIWGKSNWMDVTGEHDARVLTAAAYESIYTHEIFQAGWAMVRYLNERGIAPYLTASGDVPRWMLGADGKTLSDFTAWAEMMASYVEWAVRREHLRLSCVGLLNETDLGSPEGPTLDPTGYVQAIIALDAALQARGLHDVKLVIAEQAHLNTDYVRAFIAHSPLAARVTVVGMHLYSALPDAISTDLPTLLQNSAYNGCRLWMTEYGDLEQSGEREWFVAWAMTERLFSLLSVGFQAALAWDAFDNYHDHDEWWTVYGLLRTGLRVYTPKKRYFAARQVYRFVRPGFVRVDAAPHITGHVRVLAFTSADRTQVTLIGMNTTDRSTYLNVRFSHLSDTLASSFLAYYRTSEDENCVRVGDVPVRRGENGGGAFGFDGAVIEVPAYSIFTLTNVLEV